MQTKKQIIQTNKVTHFNFLNFTTMKTKFKYLMVLTAALVLGLSSCSKDDEQTGGTVIVDNGKPTNMTLAITSPRTYATADPNATEAEAALNTVDVFIYNTSHTLVKHATLLLADFTLSSSSTTDVYTAITKIPTTTGAKQIYVGVNLTAPVTASILANGVSAVNSIANVSEITNITTGFVMFSQEPTLATLVANDTDPANKVTATVKRLVAKVAMQAGSGLSLNITGGVISDVDVAMKQINKRYFPLPFIDGAIVKDPNWESAAAGVIKTADFYDSNAYLPINVSGVAVKDLVANYVTENTSENQFEDENSYASVRAKFVPTTLKTYTNGTDATGGFSDLTNTGNAVATFYRLPLANGTSVFAAELNILTDYATANSLSPAAIKTYTDGFAYYNVFLNTQNNYNVFRNDFYKITVNRINGLGNNIAEDVTHQPLEDPTNISVNIEVTPWNLVSEDIELTGR